MRSIFIFILTLLGSSALVSQNADRYVIKNVSYLDYNEDSFLKGNILINKGKIESIGQQIELEEEIKAIDGTNKFLIPGLFDSHIHLFQSGGIYTRPDIIDLSRYKSYSEERAFLRENAYDLLKRYLRCGITSVIDIGGPMYQFEIRDSIEKAGDFPNLFMTGPLITVFDVPAWDINETPIQEVRSEEEARQMVRDQLSFRPDFIKIWGMPLPGKEDDKKYKIITAAIDEAKKNNIRIFVHATRLSGAKLAIKEGADVLVHMVSGWSDNEFSEMLRDSNVVLIPTMVVSRNYSHTFTKEYKPSKEDFEISNPFVLGEIFDTEHILDEARFQQPKEVIKNLNAALENADKNVALNFEIMQKYGNTIATGTDAGNIGTLHASSFYQEIQAMQKAGLSNLDILKASTIHGAIAAGKEDLLGSIEVGKGADLLLLDSNPLEDLENLKHISSVIKSGKVQDLESLIPVSPEILAQMQLNAYNAGDIDAFLAPYSEDVEVYTFPNQLSYKGKDKTRPGYKRMFENNPDLHCELVDRIVYGNTVVDKERITGIDGVEPFEALAIYKIENNKINQVYFVR